MIAQLPQYWFNKTGATQRRNTVVTDGSVAVTYVDFLTSLPMRLVSVRGGENGNQERLNTQNPYQIYLSGGPDVIATDRIVFDDRVFDILSVNNPDENSTYTRCDCEEVSPSNATPIEVTIEKVTLGSELSVVLKLSAIIDAPQLNLDLFEDVRSAATSNSTSSSYIAIRYLLLGTPNQGDFIPTDTWILNSPGWPQFASDQTGTIEYVGVVSVTLISPTLIELICDTPFLVSAFTGDALRDDTTASNSVSIDSMPNAYTIRFVVNEAEFNQGDVWIWNLWPHLCAPDATGVIA